MSDEASGWREYPPLELQPLLALALDEIVEHGYDGTSVRKIANRAGVTVPALYYHFENKQAMLRELLDHAMRIVLTHARAALQEAGADCPARLSALVEAIVAVHRPPSRPRVPGLRTAQPHPAEPGALRRPARRTRGRTARDDPRGSGAGRLRHPASGRVRPGDPVDVPGRRRLVPARWPRRRAHHGPAVRRPRARHRAVPAPGKGTA